MTDNQRKPAIRYAEFNDVWEQCKLCEISKSLEYGLNAASKKYDGKNKYLRITDINDETRLFSDYDLTSPDVDLVDVEEYKLCKGEILFVRTGASVGKTYIYRCSDGLVYYAGFLVRAKIKTNYDADFVFQNTLTEGYSRFVRITSQRSGQPGINAQEYGEYLFPIPETEEQSKIGRLFRYLDNLITLHQREYDKALNIKKAMLKKMFPKSGEDRPEIRFKGFTDAWEQRKLGDVIDLCSGKDYKHLSNGSIPVYGTGGYMLSVNEALSYDKDAIGIGRKGTIDNPYVLKAPFWTVDTLFFAIPKDNNDLNCVFAIFQNIDWRKKDESTGVPSLSKIAINQIDILMPGIEEQLQVGRYFKQLNNLITLHQRELKKLQNMKKALLEKMFV